MSARLSRADAEALYDLAWRSRQRTLVAVLLVAYTAVLLLSVVSSSLLRWIWHQSQVVFWFAIFMFAAYFFVGVAERLLVWLSQVIAGRQRVRDVEHRESAE